MSTRTHWDAEGPTLCHGSAGVLLCAQATDNAIVAENATAALLAQHDPARPFSFQHRDHGVVADEPGLLVGTAGIVLTLAERAALPAPPVVTPWTAALLMPSPFHSPISAPTTGRFLR